MHLIFSYLNYLKYCQMFRKNNCNIIRKLKIQNRKIKNEVSLNFCLLVIENVGSLFTIDYQLEQIIFLLYVVQLSV